MRSFLWSFLCLFAGLPSYGAPIPKPTDSWHGQNVMPKRPHKEISFGNRVNGKLEEFPLLEMTNMEVREDKEGRLRIFDGRREGWVDKADFVLVKDASDWFSEQLKEKPDSTWHLFMRGTGRMLAGDSDAAIEDFDKYIPQRPDDAWGYFSRGFAWYGKREFDKAIKDFDETIRLDPKNINALNNRGVSWFNKKDYRKAIKDFDELIQLEPKNTAPINNRALAWMMLGEYDKAIRGFDDVIRLDPNNAGAFCNRGSMWTRKKDYDKAIEDFNESIRIKRKNPNAFNNRGIAWRHKEEYAKAISDDDEAIALDPKSGSGLLNKALLFATCRDDKFRDLPKAKELLKAVVDLKEERQYPHIEELRSVIAAAEGRFDDAIKHQKNALEDKEYVDQEGEFARERIRVYEQKKPWRE